MYFQESPFPQLIKIIIIFLVFFFFFFSIRKKKDLLKDLFIDPVMQVSSLCPVLLAACTRLAVLTCLSVAFQK